MKKTKRLFGLFFMVFTLLAGSLSVFADSDVITQYGFTDEQMVQEVERLISDMESLTNEEINQMISLYQNQEGYEEYVAMYSTWLEISEGAGAFKEVLIDQASYEATEGGFIAEIPVKMENKEILVNIDFSMFNSVSITFSAEGADSMSLGTIFKKAGINTIIGMGTVFVMLIFISILIWLLGFVPKLIGGDNKKKAAVPAPVAAAPVAAPVAVKETAGTDDKELVAVIAAAIAAATGTSTDSFVVRSIRKVKRG